MAEKNKQNRVVGDRPRIETFPFYVGDFFQYEDNRPPRLWVVAKIESRTRAIVFADIANGVDISRHDYNPHQHSAVDHYYSGKYEKISEEQFEDLRKKLIAKI